MNRFYSPTLFKRMYTSSLDIFDALEYHTSIELKMILGRSRVRKHTYARFMLYLVLYEGLNLSYTQIATCCRNHYTSVMSGVKMAKDNGVLISVEKDVDNLYIKCTDPVYGMLMISIDEKSYQVQYTSVPQVVRNDLSLSKAV